jgi:cellulose synthase/poly-beta-1,6-N-acetylglucosamine synthase-like glycosyltransferase
MNFIEILIAITIIFLLGYIIISIKLFLSLNNLNYLTETNQLNASIIVSLHNEEKNVKQLVDSLVQQDYPKKKIEIILVNDRSTDRTQELLEKARNYFDNIKIISIDKLYEGFAPKKFAIDTALKQAKGEIILLTDADGRPAPKWIKTMVFYFSENTGIVIGNAPYFDNTLIQKTLAMEYFSHSTIAAATAGLGYPLTCVGTNMAYRKKVYMEINGFGEFKSVHSGDDDLFLQRVRENTNWEIRYATSKESHVKNTPPNSLKQFVQQRLRYASKGFRYPFKVTISLITYYLFNLLLFLFVIFSLINSVYLNLFLIVIFLKGLVDYSLLKKSSKILSAKIYFKVFPIVFILHIPYVLIFGLMGNIIKYKWAGINH